jgi:RimJ/RimL family protein N-acetyltransferase
VTAPADGDGATSGVWLRPTTPADADVLFAHQADPVASAMAGFPSRDRQAYDAHWSAVAADAGNVRNTVLVGDQVAGSMMCWGPPQSREIGYWIGRDFWGRHVATDALRLFVTEVVTERPLHGYVVRWNVASQKVLLSCGFVQTGVDDDHLVFTLH